MITAEHVSSSEQETSFNETPGTSSDEHAIVPAENFNNNETEMLQNQITVVTTSPNTVVRQLSESFDDWSTSSESDVIQGQLVEHMPNQVNQPSDLFGNGTNFVNTFTGNTNLHPTFTEKRIFKGPVTVHQNVYCCPSTFFDGLRSCANKRSNAIFIATSLGVLILILLCNWFSNSKVTKQLLIPVTPISNTTINEGIVLSATDLEPTSAPTVSSDQVIHVSTELSLNEPTTTSNGDYSHNTGQKNEKNEIINVNNPLKIVTRTEWEAAPPLKPLTKLKVLPARRVIISETSTESCDETEKCMKLIRKIQRMYSNPVSCPDIAYNFLVGGDGLLYEGRGWDIKGNVATYFDHESINIGFIGNFSLFIPPEKQIKAALNLIRFGVENNHISIFFQLSGKKQLTYMNENPGDKLYNVITKWQQWEPGTIGIDLHNKAFDDEYNQTMSYLNIFSGTKFKFVPKRGRN